MAGSASARIIGGLLRRPPVAPTDPEKDFIDEMIERLAATKDIEFDDPYYDGAVYRVVHVPGGCPNVHVFWRKEIGLAWRRPCITCSGHVCEGHHNITDDRKWDLARTVLTAIFAGRRVEELSTSRHCSTHPGVYDAWREVSSRGEGSAGQEARDGRAAQPEAAGREAVDRVTVAFRRMADAVAAYGGVRVGELRPRDPTPVAMHGVRLVITTEVGQPPQLQARVGDHRVVYTFGNGETWTGVDGRVYRFSYDNDGFGILEVE